MSGFQLKCLDQNADRISVQSTENPTWAPIRRRFSFLPAKGYEVPLGADELVVIKTRGQNEIELIPHDTDLVIRSSRRGALVSLPGQKTVVALQDGEAITIRHRDAREPQRPHRTARPDEIT